MAKAPVKKTPTQYTAYQLQKQTEAAHMLLRDLQLISKPEDDGAETSAPEDQDLIHDTVEGETGLFEAIDATVESLDEDEILLAGIKALISTYDGRKKRIETRMAMKRAMIQRAMEICEITPIERPRATLSLTKKPAALLVVEESEIPPKFFVVPPTPDPVLDKKLLTLELKVRKEAMDRAMEEEDLEERQIRIDAVNATFPPIPGAELDNGGSGLTIRRK